ncbi:hypothetical protein FRC02_005715, partial [Tulasnella sp. 418]
MARAALSQLYPSDSPLNEYNLWPVRTLGDKSFFTYHKTLVEFRMVTIWAINECRWKKTLGVSLRRYLYLYCHDMLEFSMARVSELRTAKTEDGANQEADVAEEEPQAIEQGKSEIPAEGNNDKNGGEETKLPPKLSRLSTVSPVIERWERRWSEDLGNKGLDEREQEQACSKAKAEKKQARAKAKAKREQARAKAKSDQEKRRIIWQYGEVFKSAMVLAYLVIENRHDILRTVYSGESTPMKAARCLMALSRWFGQTSDLDTEIHYSFAHALLSATHTYLQLAAKNYQPSNHLPSPDKSMEHDENTIFVGMKHLEIPLIHLACYAWQDPTEMQDLAVSTLELFYSIPGHAEVKLLEWDPPTNLNILVDRLKTKLQTADLSPAEQVSGIRTCTRVLQLMSNPGMVITSAFTGTGDLRSLSAIIGSMAQKDCMELRVTILSAVLDTPIFCPRKAEGNPSDPGALSGHLAIDLSPDPNAVDLSELYREILRDHSLLLKAANELNKPLSRRLVQLTLLFIEKLLGSRDRGVLLEHGEYPNVLPSIAWPSQGIVTEESIPARKLAVKLFAQLWTSAPEGDETKKSMGIDTVD